MTLGEIRRRGRWSLVLGTLVAGCLLGSVIASGAELVTAELDGTANDVTVVQGASANFTINLRATGNISALITAANPSKAKVKTSYSLNAAGSLSSGATFSPEFNFYAGTTGCGTNNCDVTWNGAPTQYAVSAIVSANAATPVGTYSISLSEAAGTTLTPDPNVAGGKLDDATATVITVRVVAPSDSTPPVITETVTGTVGTNGWYTSNVSLSWTVVDNQSSISSQDGCSPTNVTADQSETSYTCTATSAGGTASKTVKIKRDATAPTISGSRSPAANGAGWNTTNVSVSFACTDTGSGVTSCGPNQTISSEGANQSASGTAVDNAGNSASASVTGINIDKTDPTLTASAVKGSGSTPYTENSWTNENVTVTFTCSDGGSNVASGSPNPASQSFTSQGTHSAGSSCSDVAGNTATTSFALKVDKTAPVVTVASVKKGDDSVYTPGSWTNQDVTVDFDCTDGLSGVFGLAPDPVVKSGSAANQTASTTCTDNAGNSASGSQGDIDIDKVAPTITAAATVAGGGAYTSGAWTNKTVTVSFTCSDALSGISGACPADVVVSADTSVGGRDVSASVEDNAGNSATSNTINVKVDKTAPTITGSATVAGGGAYTSGTWTNQTVTVSFSCSDALSGVAGSCPADVSVATSTPAAGQNVSANVGDNAGNSATSNVITVKVDKTAPVATVTGIANGQNYTLGSVPATGCSTTDLLSGVKAQATLQPLTGSGTTHQNGVGSFTATCSGAEDNAGNTGSTSVTYNVVYGNLVRFLQPINFTAHSLQTGPDVSTFKAGSTVPAKVQIKLPNGTILQSSSVNWITPQKGGSTTQPVDESEYSEPATSGTTFVWSAVDQFYQYNWKTDRGGAGFYWLIGAKLDDGQTYRVYISLR